jgi:fructose-1,6-bisphosphatase/inositol monophosphatase family enzyme
VWDYLAASLICAEAGVRIVDAADRDLVVLDHAARRTPVAAATPELLDALLAIRRG